ncbi:MAG: RNA polymerase sigma factor [Sphingomonas oligoaromativorans]|uniref:RNA polymerase sigma factor n=1 Tax=Sphingomonas oligoaromativorans TaxID=575322 RepID=UPI00141DE1A2|nr:sigma-70 family RNA polymerase sigma factor [Sphingomonas oligoaromativorans]NIJ32634.1 RNA polymerase sigma-70 factor (ECF subfamily) [Sphingomonas oligoaromativorans]
MALPFDDRAQWLADCILPHERALRDWLARSAFLSGDRIDDLVQETYAVLAQRADVASIRNPRSYAFQVAKSILLQDLRRSRVVAIGSVTDLEMLDQPADMPSPEQQAIGRDELARVATAIAAMPRQTRRAFQLRRVEGLSQRDVAAALGLSESTVEKHIVRGIKLLMQQFGRGGKASSDASISSDEGRAFAEDRARNRAEH